MTVKTPLVAEQNTSEKVRLQKGCQTAEPMLIPSTQRSSETSLSPPVLTTALTPAKDWSERATPRAQTRQEAEEFDKRPSSRSQLAGESFV